MNRFTYALWTLSIVQCAPSHAEPPAEREAGASQQADVQTFAVDSVLLGDVVRLGADPDIDAWKSFGYDLDGLVTDSTSTNVCTLFDGAPRINQRDGHDGRDNAFGASVLPIYRAAAGLALPSDETTTDIVNGRWTIQLRITGIDNTSTRDSDGLRLDVLTSDAFDDGKPTFDTTTDWPVAEDSLDANGNATAHFDDAYIAGGTFVAGATANETVIIRLQVLGVTFPLRVHAALVTFAVGGDAELTSGIIAGVLDREETVDALALVAARISPSLCGSAFDAVADQLRETADILVDRSNAPNVPCTGISFAMGFHAKRVANPTKVTPVSVVDPCAPAGDAGTDG